mmetsp:Transcript_33597/g.95205  ORF Transcript_33597/g.95205 Transcript_33597/m.95205 type:complete len:240 (+) Transcript_33597:129-848(+)
MASRDDVEVHSGRYAGRDLHPHDATRQLNVEDLAGSRPFWNQDPPSLMGLLVWMRPGLIQQDVPGISIAHPGCRAEHASATHGDHQDADGSDENEEQQEQLGASTQSSGLSTRGNVVPCTVQHDGGQERRSQVRLLFGRIELPPRKLHAEVACPQHMAAQGSTEQVGKGPTCCLCLEHVLDVLDRLKAPAGRQGAHPDCHRGLRNAPPARAHRRLKGEARPGRNALGLVPLHAVVVLFS